MTIDSMNVHVWSINNRQQMVTALSFKVKLMSKMKILHIKELILLIIIVKRNHSTHIKHFLAAI